MSVHKLPRTHGFGWQVRWRDERGKPHGRAFDRKGDADRWDAEVKRAKQLGSLERLDAGKITLAEFGPVWWKAHVAPHLAERTMRLYAHAWDKHVLPHLGHLPLRKIRPREVSEFSSELHRRGVGPAMGRKVLSVLQQVMDHAVLLGEIETNPVKAIRKPKAPRAKTPEPLAPSAVEHLRQQLELRDATVVSVLAYAGLRPGETLALQWKDVGHRTLHISKSRTDGAVKETKTGQSRSVSLLGALRDDLAAWYAACGSPDPETLLFPSSTGNVWRDADWDNWRNRIFRPGLAAAELPRAIPYDLRHSFASLLIHEGRLTIVEIAAQLGHQPTVCLKDYAHIIAELAGGGRVDPEQEIGRARRDLGCMESA